MALTTGDTIGPYEVLGEIGEGGMAVVYHARHTILGSDHAVKVLHERIMRTDEIRHRFLEEGRIQAQLRHPHIVPVTDVIAAPGVAGLVMPLLGGQDLQARLDADGPVSVEVALRWTVQILQALAYVHERGIVHRDLKPANVFIEQTPQGQDVRVMDFGIAKVRDRSRTRTAVMMGTPAYMSPEQIRAPGSVDARADLFAVGCILYELLAGAPAFDGDTEFDIQTRIVEGRFTPLQRWLSMLPERIDAIVRKALAVRPDDRFASAQAFCDAIASRETIAPPPMPKPSATPPMARPKRRPIELGVFRVGRGRRLVLATLGLCMGGVLGSQIPTLLQMMEVWEPIQAELAVSDTGGVLIFAGLSGGFWGMFGYWLAEIGCLVLVTVVLGSLAFVLGQAGLV